MESKNITIAFPCYQPTIEQWNALEHFIKDLKMKSQATFEYIVVDDGSTQWVEPPQSLKDQASIIRMGKNQGKGAVLKEAVHRMSQSADVFSFIDFDLPYTVDDLLGVCAGVLYGSEVCIGDRTFTAGGVSRRISRAIAHRLFRLFMRMVVTGGVFDTQCGVKAYDATAISMIVEKSRLNGFLFDIEWLYIALSHRLTLRCWSVDVLEQHSSSRLRSFFNINILRELSTFVFSVLNKQYLHPNLKKWVLENQKKIQQKEIVLN